MSKTIGAIDGHVGVFVGPRINGENTVGVQVEDQRGAKSLTRVRLRHEQAIELGLEILDRATDEPMAAALRACLQGGGFLP